MSLQEADYLLALTAVRGVGGIRTRKLLECFGSGEEVFSAPLRHLVKVPGFPEAIARRIKETNVLQVTGEIRRNCDRMGIRMVALSEAGYPKRLAQCPDSPFVLFYKGADILGRGPVLAIVGTRKITHYGNWVVRHLMQGLSRWSPVVVSGLAYGVDITAHREALRCGMDTVAVLPGGIDQLYPSSHTQTAAQITMQGGLISEMPPGTVPEKEYFPVRNRIIAGMADAVLVVESGKSGGSMITAYLAHGYQRDVLAIPGRLNDPMSAGPNYLIQTQVAHPVDDASAIAEILGWGGMPGKQTSMFPELTEEERSLMAFLGGGEERSVDEISVKMELPQGEISSLLLSLEFKGCIRMLPGDRIASAL